MIVPLILDIDGTQVEAVVDLIVVQQNPHFVVLSDRRKSYSDVLVFGTALTHGAIGGMASPGL